MAPSADRVAHDFVKFYYATLAKTPELASGFFRQDGASATLVSGPSPDARAATVVGKDAIQASFDAHFALGFAYNTATVDNLSAAKLKAGALVVKVTGSIEQSNSPKALPFVQNFLLGLATVVDDLKSSSYFVNKTTFWTVRTSIGSVFFVLPKLSRDIYILT